MRKAISIVFGVVIGFVVWFVVATVGNLIIRGVLPGYTEAEQAVRFTLPMLLARLGVGAVSSIAAGLACALSARHAPNAVGVFAAALVLFFVPVHYALWAQFPAWYHVAFLVSLAPLVWLGAKLFRSGPESARAA